MERVGAALDDEVQPGSAGLLGNRLAGGRDVHGLEVVPVEVRRRRAGQRHVGDRHAVHGPDRVLRPRALRDEVGLLSGLVSADVDAVHEDAIHRAQQGKRIARRRDVGELVDRDVGRRSGLADIDHRRRCRHLDGFGQRADGERDRQVDGLAHTDDHAVANARGKPCQRRRELVVAGSEIEETVASVDASRECPVDVGPLEGDIDARERKPGRVRNAPGDNSGGSLRRCRSNNEEQASNRSEELIGQHLTYPL